MADNLPVTPGSGAKAWTDEISDGGETVHKQLVGLADATADSGTRVAAGNGTATNALRVTIASDTTGVLSIDDNGGAITVDGTVTANLSATDNAVLDTIETNTDFGAVVGGGVEATALRVTIASDSTGLVSVDDGGASLTVDSAALDAIQTAVELIDNAISGTEMQVDVVAELPAGTNNIGDVDVASIAAGETHIGAVGASDTVVTITASLDTSAYTAGDVLFDTQEIANAARTSGGVVVLQSVTVLDKDDQAAAFDLVFLDAATSLGTENAAVSIADADAEDVLGVVSITADDYADFVNSQIATKSGIGLEMKANASTSLYVGGIARGTPTHSASGLVIKFAFLRS